MIQATTTRRQRETRSARSSSPALARRQAEALAAHRTDQAHVRLVPALASARCEVGPAGRRRDLERVAGVLPDWLAPVRYEPTLGRPVEIDAEAEVFGQAGDVETSAGASELRVALSAPEAGAKQMAAASAGLRITARGRLVIAATVLVAVVAAALLVLARYDVSPAAAGASLLPSPAASSAPAPTRTVTVLPGQTLWQIAQDVAPQDDPRDVIIGFKEVNGLADSGVYAGQVLIVPQS